MNEIAPSAASFDVNGSLIRNSAWMVGLRWTLRGIGLVSTFILARLLTPEDFGLVAMAALIIGLVEVFGQTGQILALIRHPNPSREHFDTVWTMSIIIGAVITTVLWGLAPLSAEFFHEPRAAEITRILALRALIGGFENIGVVAFRKDLQFSKEYSYQVAQRVLNFALTISLALWLRSYWALILGILGGRLITVAISYRIHLYRPRLCLSKTREIWSFSAWMLLVHVAQFLQDKIDEFVVGNMTDTETMGNYNVAADAATAPTVEMVLPATRALFPIFSRIAGDRSALAEAYLGVFSTTAIVVCASATGVMLVAGDFVAVLLGPRWSRAVPLVELLAMSGAFYCLMQSGITLIGAAGHGRTSAVLAVSRAVLTIPAIVTAGWLGSVEAIAATRTAVAFVFIPGVFIALARILPLRPMDLLRRLWRPAAAAAAMAAVIKLAHPLLPDVASVRLVIEIGAGAATYGGTLLSLWWLAGRPAGPERGLVAAVGRVFAAKVAVPSPPATAGRLRIFVVATFSSQSEGRSVPRSAWGWLRNRGRRGLDFALWRLGGRWGFHYSTYQDRLDSNRGDSAIRRATVQLLRQACPGPLEITEFGWEQIDDVFAGRANAGADLVVIAGGGYISCNGAGELPDRFLRHLDVYRRLSCPIVGFGLGLNCLSSYQTGQPRMSARSVASLGQFSRLLALLSVRDEVTRQALAGGEVIPDPALLLEPKAGGLPRRSPGDGVWLGLNLAFHGPASTLLLARLFPIVVDVLRTFGRTHRLGVIYFVHSDAERLIPRLLRAEGIVVTVVDGPPEEMLSWYGMLDIHLCEMLHSCILAANRGVPTLNLAYDSKNWAFYQLMGMEGILSAATADAAAILGHLSGMLERRDVLSQAMLRRKEDLRRDMDVVLARVARLLSGEAGA